MKRIIQRGTPRNYICLLFTAMAHGRLLCALPMLLWVLQGQALTVGRGVYYFDNSLTQYAQVKFVYGSDRRKETYVVSLTRAEGQLWRLEIAETAGDMYRYTFAETSMADGRVDDSFPNVKEYISKTLGELRTATTDQTMLAGGVFVPSSGDNWAQGSWQAGAGGKAYSETLPVLYINTAGSAAINSKDTYVDATCYLDPLDLEDVDALGTAESPVALQIRGRGNYTWSSFEKKPYRLKFEDKQYILGMHRSRHFALLAHADDRVGFMRNTIGFEVSRRVGMPWTPEQRPVELVLNGEYRGLYFLTETVRVASSRVNIDEQADEEADPEFVTGGWLVEIDNYDDDNQIQLRESADRTLRITYHTPEKLSALQRDYLTGQWEQIIATVYAQNKNSTSWEQLVDIDQLARFYLVQEIMDNQEAFHGSCFVYKDWGDDTRWMFGPVWDFGNAHQRGSDRFIWQQPQFGNTLIDQIVQFPRFMDRVKYYWTLFYTHGYPSLSDYADDYAESIAAAAVSDGRRWPQYSNADEQSRERQFMQKLSEKVEWLYRQWGTVTGILDEGLRIKDESNNPSSLISHPSSIYDLQGRKVMDNGQLKPGIYIVNGKKIIVK